MRLQCPSCGLRLNAPRFLLENSLYSICDICRLRGLDYHDFSSISLEKLADFAGYTYYGGSENQHEFLFNKKERKRLESFIQDFDSNELAQEQISGDAFNQALVNHPNVTGNSLAENLQQLGLDVTFQLNEIDYYVRQKVRQAYDHRCQYCGRHGESVDHKDPVSLSHNNDFDNLILSCDECNRIKSTMPYQLFCELNAKISKVNQKLVKFENLLNKLDKELQERRSAVAGLVHIKGVINDPELNLMRKKIKKLQELHDTAQADYDSLNQQREAYFTSSWKLFETNDQLI
ncbi:MAG: HNH endonuclease signature motif containing protein [Lactobacillus sp.]|nr:HNH endonuclease signature motif containing protein [Lactobacillus sp.]